MSLTPTPISIHAARPASLGKRPRGGPPPLPRSINSATVLGLVASAFALALIAFSTQPSVRDIIWLPELEFMQRIVANRTSWLTSLLRPIWNTAFHFAVPLLVWPAVIVLVATRRFRNALTFFASFLLVVLVVSVLQDLIVRPRPLGIEILGHWEGFAHPDRKLATITAAITATVLHSFPHGPIRRASKIIAGAAIAVLAIAAVYLGVATPSAATASIAIGFSITQLMFRAITPPEVFPVRMNKGNTAHLEMTTDRVEAIRSGVAAQLNIEVVSAKAIALDGSAGSTPLLLDVDNSASGADEEGQPTKLFAKLYAESHLRSDRLYKIGRSLLYGNLEDEVGFASVRRLVQHEDYLASKMAGVVRTARSHGIVEITPDREYVIVFEFLDGATELGDVVADGLLTIEMIDDGIDLIDRLWRAGLAHRDIKPSNLMVTAEGRLALIDVAFGEVRPTRWRQSVDLGNMLLLLTLGSDAELVYERALIRFSEDEIADALASTRSVAIPGQLRSHMKASDRDVGAELRALTPARKAVRVQRWSFARLVTGLGALTAGLIAFVLITSSAQLAGLLP